MQRKFVTYTILFFIPVILGYGLMEYFSREITSGYKNNGVYLQTQADALEILILGSSQMNNAVNPAWLDRPTINLASGDQHHNTDFKLYKSISTQLPKLKVVVLEVSYSHFELPHNAKDFWKNCVYLEYYDANCYERSNWFKDRMLFLSNPQYFSKQIKTQFIDKEVNTGFNKFGFDTLNFSGRFKSNDYDEAKIAKTNFKINLESNLDLFHKNTSYFKKMLDRFQQDDKKVIIVTVPMYRSYLPKRNKEILKRRNKVLQEVSEAYNNVHLFQMEEDTINFNVRHYWNQSHLNPDGAKVFTQLFQEKLKEVN